MNLLDICGLLFVVGMAVMVLLIGSMTVDIYIVHGTVCVPSGESYGGYICHKTR